jgi:predicted nuclease with RNAse H fold
MNHDFLGIDYGAKLAGTTAVCFAKNGQLQLFQSSKKKDTDVWLRSIITAQQPSAIFIDAPISLPSVYKGIGSDFHYRACDRAVGAMSPMFLGGLTARAMQLRASFPHLPFYEVYPAHHVRLLFASAMGYKTDLELFLEKLAERLPYPFAKRPENWHQVDSALAWLTGWRHGRAEGITFGEAREGMIWI